jgi:Ca2+-binding RTX toxin-like protein
MRQARFQYLTTAVLSVFVLAAAFAPDASAVVSGECRYVARPPAGVRGNALLITLNQNVGIRRDGSSIGVYERGGTGSEVTCLGREATTHSIDRIVFRPDGDNHQLTIDESGGRFEPGASPEPGGDEIEIVAVFPRDSTRRNLRPGIRILGTPGPDTMRIGRQGRDATAINLDIRRDGQHRDADVLGLATWPADYLLDGRGGNDRLGSSGRGREFAGPLPENHVALRGGDGDDILFGGPRRDLIQTGDGNDVAYGRGGDDRISMGGGFDRVVAGRGDDSITVWGGASSDSPPDLISGGSGRDSIRALDGQVESINCGPGLDHVWIDAFDLWSRRTCEKPHGPGFD